MLADRRRRSHCWLSPSEQAVVHARQRHSAARQALPRSAATQAGKAAPGGYGRQHAALPAAIAADRPRAVGVATLDENERAHIRKALAVTGGKIHGPRGAANILDINHSTLRSRMEKLGIEAA